MKKMFLLFGMLAMVGVLFVACTDEPATAPDEASFKKTYTCDSTIQESLDAIHAEVDAVLESRQAKKGAHQIVDNIGRKVCAGDTESTANMVMDFEYLLDGQPDEELVGGRDRADRLLAAVEAFAAGIAVPPAVLDSEGEATIAVIEPATATEVVTPSFHAAVIVEANSFLGTEPITIIIVPSPTLSLGGEYPVIGRAYDMSASQQPDDEVVVEMCVPDPPPVPFDWIAIGHDTGDGVDVLPRVTEGLTVQCADAFEGELADASGLGKTLMSFFAPKPLHAALFAGTGLGGRTKSFSDFAPIDVVSGTPSLIAPPEGFVVPQNNPALSDDCDVHPTRGIGYEINFEWSFDGIARTFDLRAELVGSQLPIVNTTVIGTNYRHYSCNSFVDTPNLEADWEWKVRVHTIDGSAPWSPANTFTWEPCTLGPEELCNTGG